MYIAALALVAVVLAWPGPRLLTRLTSLRRAPRAALVLWQATAVAAVLAALFTAPAAVALAIAPREAAADHPLLLVLAGVTSGAVAAQLLLSGHRVGTNLRAARRRHRELVDLIAVERAPDVGANAAGPRPRTDARMRVLEHPTPTAYCVPGLRRRVVVTQGTIDSLPDDELDAVLAHERAHLSARHDLVLEFFTVVHLAVPRFARADAGLQSVRLLIEVLADRAAVRLVGVVSTARAIVRMAGGSKPAGTMAMREEASDARLRLALLDAPRIGALPTPVVAALMYAASVVIVAAPVALLTAALAGRTPG